MYSQWQGLRYCQQRTDWNGASRHQRALKLNTRTDTDDDDGDDDDISTQYMMKSARRRRHRRPALRSFFAMTVTDRVASVPRRNSTAPTSDKERHQIVLLRDQTKPPQRRCAVDNLLTASALSLITTTKHCNCRDADKLTDEGPSQLIIICVTRLNANTNRTCQRSLATTFFTSSLLFYFSTSEYIQGVSTAEKLVSTDICYQEITVREIRLARWCDG